jgi:hypothetical protein
MKPHGFGHPSRLHTLKNWVSFCTLPLTMHLAKIVVKVVGNGEITLTNMRERLESLPFQKLKS